jgi:hypothetical protein
MTSVSDSPLLPSNYAVLSESGAVSDLILKDPNVGLSKFLADAPAGLKYFEGIVISDFGLRKRPDDKSVFLPFSPDQSPRHTRFG